MESLIENFFNINIMTEAFPLLLRGLRTTILLCVIVIPLGLIGGLFVALLTNISLLWHNVVGVVTVVCVGFALRKDR